MKIVIIKYNAGNIRSVYFALKRLGIEPEITDDPEKIRSAHRVIFPGVGEASTTMGFLKNQKMDLLIKELKQPVLGICLGMQLMCRHSEEGDTECLGIFDLRVKRFANTLKVPHMGWNQIKELQRELFDSTLVDEYVYFVHSYFVEIGTDTAAVTDYINPFSSAIQKNNFYATQFHPEKSGAVGEKILKNFLEHTRH